MGQPDAAALTPDLIDHMLGWHADGVDVFLEVEAEKVVTLATEWIVRMQFCALDQYQPIGCRDGVGSGDLVVVGEAKEVVSLRAVSVDALLRRRFSIGVGGVRVQVALDPEDPSSSLSVKGLTSSDESLFVVIGILPRRKGCQPLSRQV